ncbi:MAG: HD domain-containing protein [Lachnospiraceae bacterium]|nr:HD domain-containing protein [Lachnospiraceae bacterium]
MNYRKKNNEYTFSEQHEYIANSYVIRCFTIMMIIFSLTFILNLLNIFVIEQDLMLKAYIPSMIIYIAFIISTKFIPLTSRKTKYYVLFIVTIVVTIGSVFITYHVVLMPVLLLLYATLYTSKSVLRYTYALMVISTFIIVYGGYYYGLCDANMVLLTANKVQDYIVDNKFILTEVNNNPYLNLTLFYVLPRCITYIPFTAICSSLFEIIKKSMEKVKFQAELEQKVLEQTEEIRKQQKIAEQMFIKTLTALTDAVDAKDRYTSGHSKRVAHYSHIIAEKLGKSQEEQEVIYSAGLLHDVGKIRIPIDIINKPVQLTNEEYEFMKTHTVTGFHILRGLSEDNLIALASKHHHERYDGKGYPSGLSGEDIPEIARIIGVADSYDTMSSNRSYRKLLPQQIVRDEIEKGKGTQFDPVIADIMLEIIDNDTEYTLKQDDSQIRNILLISNDESSNNEIINILAEETNYEITVAKNQISALNFVAQKYIKLILIDMSIIDKEGARIIELIKKIYGTPIIIVTEKDTHDIPSLVSKYGYNDYIVKPFKPIIVKEVIHNILERTHIDGLNCSECNTGGHNEQKIRI